MEDISYLDITASEVFRFRVGSKSREYSMHSALLLSVSPVLYRLMMDQIDDNRQGGVPWEDVDDTTFACFVQYAYTRSYRVPRRAAAAVDDADADDDGTEAGRKKNESGGKRKPLSVSSDKGAQAWKVFSTLAYPGPEQPGAEIRRPAGGDYAEVFSVHARVHFFADRYEVEGLRKQSLGNLHGALVAFAMDGRGRVDDVTALVELCFEGGGGGGGGSSEMLRTMLVDYVTCNVAEMWSSPRFRRLLVEHGELSGPLVGSMLQKLL